MSYIFDVVNIPEGVKKVTVSKRWHFIFWNFQIDVTFSFEKILIFPKNIYKGENPNFLVLAMKKRICYNMITIYIF